METTIQYNGVFNGEYNRDLLRFPHARLTKEAQRRGIRPQWQRGNGEYAALFVIFFRQRRPLLFTTFSPAI